MLKGEATNVNDQFVTCKMSWRVPAINEGIKVMLSLSLIPEMFRPGMGFLNGLAKSIIDG